MQWDSGVGVLISSMEEQLGLEVREKERGFM
jgi:hypothetical protein